MLTRLNPTHARMPMRQVSCAMLAAFLCGCTGSDSPETEMQFPPESIQLGGDSWKRQPTFLPDDQNRLVAYFQTNRSLAENPLLRGEPEVYSTAGDRKRYYWINGTGGGKHWMFLEFHAGMFTEIGEGTGDLFATNSD